ncbi:MAG: hypothetical protein LKJ76_06105 [Lachnospiraceae bacterium]|jgi:hypothetical protein|nr:hypothetical protein [Lachnospiraceae bacterium]
MLQSYGTERADDEARIQKVRQELSKNSTFSTLFETNVNTGRTEKERTNYNKEGELLNTSYTGSDTTSVGSVLTVNVKSNPPMTVAR